MINGIRNQSNYEEHLERCKRRCIDCGEEVDHETWEKNDHRCTPCVKDREGRTKETRGAQRPQRLHHQARLLPRRGPGHHRRLLEHPAGRQGQLRREARIAQQTGCRAGRQSRPYVSPFARAANCSSTASGFSASAASFRSSRAP